MSEATDAWGVFIESRRVTITPRRSSKRRNYKSLRVADEFGAKYKSLAVLETSHDERLTTMAKGNEKSELKLNRLAATDRIRLVGHLAQNIAAYTDARPAKVAELASEALGIKVTDWNISTIAEHIGLRLNYDAKTRTVVASKVELFLKLQAMETRLEKTEKTITFLADQLKVVSEDLAALEAKIGAGILS